MEAVLTGRKPQRPARPTWFQTGWAVVGGSVVAFGATLVVLVGPLFWLPVQFTAGTTGRGWPWRIEGPWSLAADLGPLLLCGAVFAFGVECVLGQYTVVRFRRAPIAVAAAGVGWVTIGNVSNAGLLMTNGLVAFIVILVVAREASVRERGRWRWTGSRAAAATVAVLALALTSASYGLLHPLSVGTAEFAKLPQGRAAIHAFLHNDGRAKVQLLAVSVPGVEIARVQTTSSRPSGEMVPFRGATIAHGGSIFLDLALPARCAAVRIDRLHVRLRVHGRAVDQVVRLAPPIDGTCS